MQAFAELLDRLYFTHGNLDKATILKRYLAATPDPDRGFAVAVIAGALNLEFFKRALVRDLIVARCDPVLFEMSYDYVGEMSETVAHLWPVSERPVLLNRLPPLSEVIAEFSSRSKPQVREYLTTLLDNMTTPQRWALLKLGTSTLRIGVSARFMKQVLADYGGVPVTEVEEVWHAVEPPYQDLFAWLEKRGLKPDASLKLSFSPVMLAHPLEDGDLAAITPTDYQAEWKFDGIRVQIAAGPLGRALYSRTGDDISGAFPDVLARADFHAVLDGELLVRSGDGLGSFNDLQQRLNRKAPTPKLMEQSPAYVVVYDALMLEGEDLRPLALSARRARLKAWLAERPRDGLELSEALPFTDGESLAALRSTVSSRDTFIEGLMLKRRDSPYVPGRPKGLWWKWKKDPLIIDAVLMYAQRGTGKRSSFFSDFTFGLWRGGELLPVGKAYFGFTDEELKQLDKWVRNHTVQRFGPVAEVEKALVLEIAFDAAQASARHKSGVALRFPRINRIRWDKPASEADELDPFLARLNLN
ncbi:MAG: cisplatin damage response ATP-dependent DNA ligase [Hyphomicrobiales bacterium]|nr:cisplatin damage response ATP-dependent DNA ligase [Hyphomicrobiales bacterium]